METKVVRAELPRAHHISRDALFNCVHVDMPSLQIYIYIYNGYLVVRSLLYETAGCLAKNDTTL